MIKNFLDADEDDFLITKQTVGEKTADKNDLEEFAAPFAKIEDDADLPKNPEPETGSENAFEFQRNDAETVETEPILSQNFNETENFTESVGQQANFHPFAAENEKEAQGDTYEIFSQSPYQTESSDETIRRSGLAYSAAIILFGSIVFTLILGWFADLLFGTSPWGKVGGIVLGSIIGFIQFFRTTSRLFENKD